MIITKLRLQEEHPMTGPTGTWPLPVCDLNLDYSAGENGYILKDCEGLGPPEFEAIVEGFDSNGIPVMSSEPQIREIPIKIGLQPKFDQTYGQLRDDLYKLIDRTIFVKLMNGSTVVAQATGFIKNFETVHFSNQPEVTMTIECQDGAFSAPKSIPIPLTTLNNLAPIINYEEGTAPAGLDLVFTVTAAHAGFSISEYSKFWAIGGVDIHNIFLLTYSFLVNDVVTISTHRKSRKITLLRAGTTYDIAGNINAGAVWPRLLTGVNAFVWSFASSWMTWNSASYTPKYWGV
jgi:hypothetical protein